MRKDIKEKWVVTLESGNYQQTTLVLRTTENKCCCLGVLCDIVEPESWINPGDTKYYIHNWQRSLPSPDMLSKVGLSDCDAGKLVQMNDEGRSFKEIAEYIRKSL